MPDESLAQYARGSRPIADDEALELSRLTAAWDECTARMDAGLAAVTAELFAAPAPFSPSDDPDETIGSLLTTVAWHQAYHAGQTGLLRRIAGKPGMIK